MTSTGSLPDVARAAREQGTAVIEELSSVLARVPEEQLGETAAGILNGAHVHWAGHGRSGLVARALSMRCMHLGLASYVVGETATPGLTADDTVLLLSATGRGNVVAQGAKAREVGATVIAWTSRPSSPLVDLADHVLVLPARTSVCTVQHAGSLVEQSCLILGDSLCGALQQHLGVSTEQLNARHATLH